MRIVIDMQGAQTESRYRGIGRHAISISRAIVRNRGEHEVFLALSGAFPDTIEPIRATFDGLLPQENIRIWHAPGPVAEENVANDGRREVAELIREAFFSSLQPDVIHITSLFEGYADDAVTSIGRFDNSTPVSVSIYSLAPLLNSSHYAKRDPRRAQHYLRKSNQLKLATIYLAASEFTRQEALTHLDLQESSIINASIAVESNFQPLPIDDSVAAKLRLKFGLTRPFVFCTGGIDEGGSLPRLVQAFARLPPHTRAGHQLLLAGEMPAGNVAELIRKAESVGLKADEIRFSGYVTDEELVQLYNLCKLFVFPAWHEGLGLSALEAMACGAAVIGASSSSLPEVIGSDSALFDPHSEEAIAHAITRGLTDDVFRDALVSHGRRQAKRFSWDESAKRAIAAFEALHSQCDAFQPALQPRHRLRLAYVSPLPPERTGIADYSAELLSELSSLYEIDVIIAQDTAPDSSINSCCAIRTVEWFIRNAERYDRVLYHFGNSAFHQHMFHLLKLVPGVVVLHDFFLGHVVAHMDSTGFDPGGWGRELYHSHGYKALQERFAAIDAAEAVWKYPCNLSVLQGALGVIVHSRNSMHLAEQWYGGEVAANWVDIPHLRVPTHEIDKKRARKILGVGEESLLVCAFGLLGPSKLNHRLLDAWLSSELAEQENCHLVFVGENHQDGYGQQLNKCIRESNVGGRIRVTGWVDTDVFRTYLAAADIGVQLRALSRGETSGTALDCMNYGLATIVNANGSFAELEPEAVWLLPDNFEDAALVLALETLWRKPEQRSSLAERARETILKRHAPAECARQYAEAIESFYRRAQTSATALIRAIAEQQGLPSSDSELFHLSMDLAATLPIKKSAKRLFLDVSATCRNDLKTGIERVARALTLALLEAPPIGYRVEPVYLDQVVGQWHYRRACHYTLGLLGCSTQLLDDEIVEPECGDILLGLDISGDILVQAEHAGLIRNWRDKGVEVYFMVHDLLPIRMPEVFPPGADESYLKWLRQVLKFNGAICVSKAVADDLADWQQQADMYFEKRRPFNIGWSHHGADLSNTSPTTGMPSDAKRVLRQIGLRPSFLMVGTIEPRKAYLQTIEAFSQLWHEGVEINLVIVGKEGWKNLPDDMRRDIPQTIERLKTHLELNKRLFWLDGISDEYLEKVYGASTCLIAASYGEGFGLPLIEAAQHKLPIIARDIPVFREVAGSFAHYFAADEPEALIDAVSRWLARTPGELDVGSMPYLSWSESASNLAELILQGPCENGKGNPPHSGIRKGKILYVDVSVVHRDDFKTGIQRVVRSVLLELISKPPEGYRVVPVYLDEIDGQWNYYPANRLLVEYRKMARVDVTSDSNYGFVPMRGDIILGLDLAGGYVVAASNQGLYKNLMQLGVSVFFLVYDLLPITHDDFFGSDDSQGHINWAASISKCSGVICISKSVANDFLEWHKLYFGELPENLAVTHFHLGADIERSFPTSGFPADAEKTLSAIQESTSFVMVGTIEPRKGHLQVINAFEYLWNRNHNVKLVIIGKSGWMADNIVGHIRTHPELNNRLIWLEGISDEYLEKVYAASTCLIAASYGEGFGLPLIEAAQHELPIIARDIPVFREVAGEHAYYFSATSADGLARAIEEWVGLHTEGKHPKSDTMPWLTWAQSSRSLLAQIGLS